MHLYVCTMSMVVVQLSSTYVVLCLPIKNVYYFTPYKQLIITQEAHSQKLKISQVTRFRLLFCLVAAMMVGVVGYTNVKYMFAHESLCLQEESLRKQFEKKKKKTFYIH